MPETAHRESLCVVRFSTSETNLERARAGDAKAFEELVHERSQTFTEASRRCTTSTARALRRSL